MCTSINLRIFAAVAIAAAVSDMLPGQRVLRTWWSTHQTVPTTDSFGAIGLYGDVDGDGVHDFLLTSATLNVGPHTRAGRITVVSGRTGQVLYDRLGSATNMWLGGVWDPGYSHDADGDGLADVPITYAPDGVSGVYEILSGRTFRAIPSFTSNQYYRMLGDLDGDGIPDRIVGDPDANVGAMREAGQVLVLSGADDRILFDLRGPQPYFGFGAICHPAADLDGDGVPDFIVVSVTRSLSPEARANHLVQVFSGRTGTEFFRMLPPPGTDTFAGNIIANLDLDGDGHVDLLIRDNGRRLFRGEYGSVTALAGPSFQRRLFEIRRPGLFAERIGSAGDLDGDGCDDFHANFVHPNGRMEEFYYSGRDLTLLRHFHDSPTEYVPYSFFVYPAGGDMDLDDFPDLIEASVRSSQNRTEVRLISGAPDGVTVIGQACADSSGNTPRIGASYTPTPGQPFHLNLSRVLPGQSAWLMLGLSSTHYHGIPLPVDLAVLGLPGCDLTIAPEVTVPVTTNGVNGIGRAIVPLTIPNNTSLRGGVFHAQWIVLGNGAPGVGGTTTRALRVTVQ